MTTSQHDVSGVGQPGFVARHGLYTAEQAAAAEAVANEIRARDLRTVRLIVVDQHGMPRAKALSPEVAIAAMSNGLDFSGAIYSLDTGNQVFVPAFAAGGGFGIDEFTGFPDVVLVPDASTFRILPWADRTGWMLCDVYFSSGAPMPLDGRWLMRRMLGGTRRRRLRLPGGHRGRVLHRQGRLGPPHARRTPASSRRRRRSASSSAATSTCRRCGSTA